MHKKHKDITVKFLNTLFTHSSLNETIFVISLNIFVKFFLFAIFSKSLTTVSICVLKPVVLFLLNYLFINKIICTIYSILLNFVHDINDFFEYIHGGGT